MLMMRWFLFLFFVSVSSCTIAVGQASSVCPKTWITKTPETVKPGEAVTFVANISSEGFKSTEPLKITYDWSLDAGMIVSGQGTATIVVQSPTDRIEKLSATVKISGLPAQCDNVFSEAVLITVPFVCGLAPDDYPSLDRNDEKARLLNAALLADRNPKGLLVFVIYLATAESSTSATRRAMFIRNFLLKDETVRSQHLVVSPDRVRVVFVRGYETHTAVYVLPPEDLSPFIKSFGATLRSEDVDSVERQQH
jgi:hypothetical protein